MQPQPQATYLAMISIGNYDVYQLHDDHHDRTQLPIWSFIEPSWAPRRPPAR